MQFFGSDVDFEAVAFSDLGAQLIGVLIYETKNLMRCLVASGVIFIKNSLVFIAALFKNYLKFPATIGGLLKQLARLLTVAVC